MPSLRRVPVASLCAIALALASCGPGQNGDVASAPTLAAETRESAKQTAPTSSTTSSTSTTVPDLPEPREDEDLAVVRSLWEVTDPLPLELNEWHEVPELGVDIYLHKAEAVALTSRSGEFAFPDEFPVTALWGKPELSDPFSDGDFAIMAYYNPHDTDYDVVDSSNSISFSSVINGRTAEVTPWVVEQFEDEHVGYQIYWDANPDYYVYARSRSLTLPEMGELLTTITFDEYGPSVAGELFGLEPIPVNPDAFYSATYDNFYFAGGLHVNFTVDQLVEDGDYETVDYWLFQGDADDILTYRYLAASEEIVTVHGTEGYLLMGLNLWSDYGQSALIWQEAPGVVGLLNVNDETFESLLVELANRTDIEVLTKTG